MFNSIRKRDDRIVFQVIASNKNKVPGIVHDVSASAKTFYIEPAQLVSLNNKVREIKSAIHAENIRILVSLTSLVKDYLDILDGENSNIFQYFKTLLIRGFIALKRNFESILGILEIMAKSMFFIL